jgi:hypothetical protein
MARKGLAPASSTTHLDAVEQAGGVEDHRLVLGKSVSGVLVGEGSGDDVALR